MPLATNSLLNPQLFIREAMRIAYQKRKLTKKCYMGAIDYFGEQSETKGWNGSRTVNMKLPQQFVVSTGTALTPQNITDNVVPITVAQRRHVDMSFSMEELTMDINNSRVGELYLNPGMAALISNIESYGFNKFVPAVANVVGTPGTAISKTTLLQAQQLLTDNLCPGEDGDDAYRVGMFSTKANFSMVDSLTSTYNPQARISKQFESGNVDSVNAIFGIDWNTTTLTPRQTTGTRSKTACEVKTTLSADGSTIAIKTSASGAETVAKGDRFQIAGIYAVHPTTKETREDLQWFVVTSATAAATTGVYTATVTPAINAAATAYKTVSAFPQTTNAITFVGDPNTTYNTSVLYAPEALAFVSIPLKKPSGVAFAANQSYDGLSLRAVSQYLISSDEEPTRMDAFFDFSVLRPEWATILVS